MSIEILGLTGKAGSGKDTVGAYLRQHYGFETIAFATKLKNVAREVFLWDGVKDERGRRLLQRLGTEVGRDYDPNIWIQWAERYIGRCRISNPHQRFVITDVRFPNEAFWIQSQGGKMLRVWGRGGLTGDAAKHPSEIAIADYAPDYCVCNNSDFETLYAWVDETMVTLGVSQRVLV